MKRALSTLSLLLTTTLPPTAHALEIMRWERLPLAIPLHVDEERVIFIDRNVRVGVPASLSGHLRVQSAGGAIYLRASQPIEPTRLQLQDAETGALILLDIAAEPAQADSSPLEPVRIVEGEMPPTRYGDAAAAAKSDADTTEDSAPPRAVRETPVPVVLTRFAAQNLYAPLRTVEPVPGVTRVTLPRKLPLDTLLPTMPVDARAIAAWRLDDFWLTAVRLRNTSTRPLHMDPRALQGNFQTGTFQHATLGPKGAPDDTTVVYLVTKGHGLAESLLPAVSRIDAALNLPEPARSMLNDGGNHEK
ncbi:TIGR03749 family integrating conjugative element protein [Xanthomonas campestris pv. phormiicola]|nr:TIGR03749 family integrating conjugative element protein [Xanthomonas campestris pv. phormiicola]UYC17423.1 TIGR03749 family integrating conjugative element protein [Xanthomonas campestris pv. phormiicola]